MPGTAAYWSNCAADVIAMSQDKFLGQPDLFVTLTQNDTWPDIELSVDNSPGRFSEFKKLFLYNKQGPFGEVKHHWYRHEYQKRGAINTHLVIWLKNRDAAVGLISAHIPEADNPVSGFVKHLVKQHQIHERCLKERCFKGVGSKILKICKYGFPFKTPLEKCCLDEKGVRYLYPRYKLEDAYVVPYNADLLLMWQGHVNVQKVTANGWQLYLAKYVAKSEPSLRLQTTSRNQVEN
ncbi:uncharacterized protein LOC129583481 [Paramacrobiotus metropolitanus]|uniref:uncharacterized protein LOC129583481 n=1 Tax=Paramacrobiotus metropolitanus TaxID=2943436 RepID=UPI002445F226|nr:uncharacterized protein LOC129583481 [Paramacrobiotus metropolitanus]